MGSRLLLQILKHKVEGRKVPFCGNEMGHSAVKICCDGRGGDEVDGDGEGESGSDGDDENGGGDGVLSPSASSAVRSPRSSTVARWQPGSRQGRKDPSSRVHTKYPRSREGLLILNSLLGTQLCPQNC